jgi:hypothetical protein
MADNVQSIATKLGARVVAQVPDVGGGAFGAARLARVVADLSRQTVPVAVAPATLEKLVRMAAKASAAGGKVEPAQVAASLLEAAVAAAPEA